MVDFSLYTDLAKADANQDKYYPVPIQLTPEGFLIGCPRPLGYAGALVARDEGVTSSASLSRTWFGIVACRVS
jgi:hypothetical protein